MFRSRNNEKPDITTSSLSTGNASIIKPTFKSTEQIDEIQVSEEYNEEEEDDDKSLDITIESMSAVISAAVKMSASGGSPSSLSIGGASILQPFSKIEKEKPSSRFSIFSWKKQPKTTKKEASAISPTASSLTFSQSSDDDSSLQSSPRSSSVSSPKIADDGKDELQYRGIQMKEIKGTMKTLVISEDVRTPMPQVKLERPGFARINY